jgi:hypothetical protein
VDFLPQCDKVAIMDDGLCVYFGPWCESAAQLLSKYLPASHLLAAAGGAEQPRDVKPKKKAAAAVAKKEDPKVVARARARGPGPAGSPWPARHGCAGPQCHRSTLSLLL